MPQGKNRTALLRGFRFYYEAVPATPVFHTFYVKSLPTFCRRAGLRDDDVCVGLPRRGVASLLLGNSLSTPGATCSSISGDLSRNWQVIHGHRAVWKLSEHSASSALQSGRVRSCPFQKRSENHLPKLRQINAPIGGILRFQRVWIVRWAYISPRRNYLFSTPFKDGGIGSDAPFRGQ